MRQLQFEDFKQVIAKLGNITLFHYLTDTEKLILLKTCKIYEFNPDEKIVSQGETGACFFVILSGTLNVTTFDTYSGKEVFLSVIGAGEVFGETGIFQNSKRTATVSAATTTEIICIERSDFFMFITKFTAAGFKMLMLLIDSLLRKLNDSNKELAFQRREVLDQSALDQFLQTLRNE